ncbi:Uncharacterised protein [BD1-7 clade bacterium]|uniref:DUF255 domain-containing protein n=1 Tax=BD1-7 clade bacterium TaxID=2029982 RepID=A0A5S9NWG2_9GAMM|nr:Uncharacterised protein [BD1-7 clade bacterium]
MLKSEVGVLRHFFLSMLLLPIFVALSAAADDIDISQNNLGDSLSPYLIQHRDNPIHWQPWREDVLAYAQRLNKPIFLSIGYASCHWCHVMERESFVDPEVATVLNTHFVNVKVDREERPDIDAVYMMALQIMKGEGGWPINAFLTPDGKAFFVDSYLTKDRFLKVSGRLAAIWESNANVLVANGTRLSSLVEKQLAFGEIAEAATIDVPKLVQKIAMQFDVDNGGLKGAPKFPKESLLLFLLDRAQKNGDVQLMTFLRLTLDKMAGSALFDPVSGGFFRYSVNANWSTPHFEKMLYNQALMVMLYSRAYALRPDPTYKRVVEKTVAFVEANLSGSGVFYASMDAVTNGEEGSYYLYSLDQVNSVLPVKFRSISTEIFEISASGNFNGSNIFRFKPNWAQALLARDIARSEWDLVWQEALVQLAGIRDQSPSPKVDQKAITSWNALWIRALWQASGVFDRSDWRLMAEKAQASLLEANRIESEFKRFSLNGVIGQANSTLEDHGFVVSMLITAYDSTGESTYLKQAESVFQAMKSRFYIEETGLWMLFQGGVGGVRSPVQSLRDENFVSAYGVVLQVIHQLLDRTNDLRYREYSANSFRGLNQIAEQPEEYASILHALDSQHLIGQRYFANGHGKVHIDTQDINGKIQVTAQIELQDGWHINSDRPGKKELVATRFEVNGKSLQRYPKAEVLRVSWAEAPINIWQDSVVIKMPATYVDGQMATRLHMQACSNDLCLPAETIEFHMFE